MKPIQRREFVKESALTAGGLMVAPAYISNMVSQSPNERVNVAVIGISGNRPRVRGIRAGRGLQHILGYSRVPNVRVATLCDVDERLFPPNVAEVEKLFGAAPKCVWDYQKALEDKEIDAVSVVVPDHWHALLTVHACQAGKDVYVEKPVHSRIAEGRKMVEAARKYKRIVMGGALRSSNGIKEGIKFVHEGKLGKVYMAKGIVNYEYRDSIEHVQDSAVPDGVHYERWLGPAPLRPFNENRFHYNWHWFWDYSTTEFGNNGVYSMDTCRWALNKSTHPVTVHCGGGFFCQDSDQEVPNIMHATYKYADGMIIMNEVRSLYSNPEAPDGAEVFIYSDQGWMSIGAKGFKTYFGKKSEPGPSFPGKENPQAARGPSVFENFISCVRSRRLEDLDCDILEGHLSTSLGHLGVISYRTGRKLTFDPDTEKFVDDREADSHLTRVYRPPYVVPERV